MKVQEFESMASGLPLEPLEVRMSHGHVTWFVCRHKENDSLVVFNAEGYTFVVPGFDWPEDVSTIRLNSHYIDCDEIDDEIWVNGRHVRSTPIQHIS